MGIVRRQSIKISFLFLFGVIAGYLNVLIIFPYCLTPEEIGLIRIMISASTLLAILLPLGAHNTIIRYFPYFQNQRSQHNGFFPLILLITLISGVLISLVLWVFNDPFVEVYKDSSPLWVDYFPYVIPLAFTIAYYRILSSYSQALMRAVVPKFFQVVVLRILLAALVLLYFTSFFEQNGLIKGLLICYLSILTLLLLYIGSLGHLHLDFRKIRVKNFRIKEMVKFGAFSMLASLGGVLVQNIDNLMIGAYTDLSETGIYSIAFSIGLLIDLPKRALLQISIPPIAKARKENDLDSIRELYQRSSTNLLLIGSLLLIGIWINLDDLYQLIPNGEEYQKGKTVVLIIGIAKLIGMMTGPNGQIIMFSRFYKWNLAFTSLLIILVFLTNYWLIPPYGIKGAALASLISLGFINAVQLLFLWLSEGLFPFTLNTLKGLLTGGIVLFFSTRIPETEDPLVDIILRSGVALILFSVITYFLKTSEDANDLVGSLYKRFLKRR